MSVNYIDQITDTAGTTHYIAEGVDTRIFTAKCTTAAATADKVATLDDDTGFSLTAGVKVAVTFTYGNSATTPTLNVNSSGAKTIVIPSSETVYITGNGITYNTWGAYETVLFTYTGTYWVNEGSGLSIYKAYSLANSNALPSQSGNSGKYLTTNGSAVSWASVDALPSQSGNSGKYLTTNGSAASWGSIDSAVSTAMGNKITYGTQDLTPGVSQLDTGVLYFVYE